MENSLFWLPDKMTGKSVSLPGNKKLKLTYMNETLRLTSENLEQVETFNSARNHMQDKLDCLKKNPQTHHFWFKKDVFRERLRGY